METSVKDTYIKFNTMFCNRLMTDDLIKEADEYVLDFSKKLDDSDLLISDIDGVKKYRMS